MREAAANLEFERAAAVRDRLRRLRSPDRPETSAGAA
jgi:excinuclease UvrABC helicase subunit UvrB